MNQEGVAKGLNPQPLGARPGPRSPDESAVCDSHGNSPQPSTLHCRMPPKMAGSVSFSTLPMIESQKTLSE